MTEKRGMKALELWCRRVTEGYPGVKIENMTTSWRDGLAFCALIHHFRPDLIDFDRLDKRDIYKNNELAFRIAERQLGIPALLDAEDMVEYEVPDRLSILTYLSQFYQVFVSNQQQGSTNSPSRTHSAKVSEIISPTAKTAKTGKVGSGRLETCWSCRRPVFLAERLVAGGKLRHRTCFTCKRCGNQLNLVGCYETETGDFVCETCPDEEKRREEIKGAGNQETVDEPGDKIEDQRVTSPEVRGEQSFPPPRSDEYDLDFEKTLESVRSKMKRKFLSELVDEGGVSVPDKPGEDNMNSLPDNTNKYQQSTATIENLNVKIKTLLGGHFPETLKLLSQEPDSFISDISEIIDGIISDAVKEVEDRAFKISGTLPLSNSEEGSGEKKEEFIVKEEDERIVEGSEDVTLETDFSLEKVKEEPVERKEKENQKQKEKVDDYPEYLNPFADDDEEEEGVQQKAVTKPIVSPRKPPVPVVRNKVPPSPSFNKAGRKIIEAPVVNLNPFWSDGEPSSDEDVQKPVPAPRASLRPQEESSPFSRSQYGSFTSLNSMSSTVSRRKKGPAPQPPSLSTPPRSQYGSPAYRSPSPTASIRSHRKSKPAPPPPSIYSKPDDSEIISPKKEKNYENKLKQNLSIPDKSSYGKWKRKKGQAPGLPIPQRRRITPLPLEDFYRELEDLEIQQRELERQGVSIEQTIRMYESEVSGSAGDPESVPGKDVEGLVLQLFDIVNQKNELFRRQAELMYLRRQQRLEEEHADLEYQIRCLMGRSERNKTDSDKAQEEELIRRLVEVVERRNEIIECLDMDRRREVEEDKSIHHHLEVFAGKMEASSPEESRKKVKSSPSFLKLVKKKSKKKEKGVRKDADKDVDEGKGEPDDSTTGKSHKSKKKWFLKV